MHGLGLGLGLGQFFITVALAADAHAGGTSCKNNARSARVGSSFCLTENDITISSVVACSLNNAIFSDLGFRLHETMPFKMFELTEL